MNGGLASLEVVVVGCAGSHYDSLRREPCSSYLLATPGASVLLDCGYGSYDELAARAPRGGLDALFLSHEHGDHVGDLGRFLDAGDCWRSHPRLIGSRATLDRVKARVGLERAETHVVEDGDGLVLDGAAFAFSATAHQVPTLAVAVSIRGWRVVYSADTGPDWRPPIGFVGSDLALIECTYDEREPEDPPFHLDAREAAALARRLHARRTVLTHVPAGESVERRVAIARAAAPDQRFEPAVRTRRMTLEAD